MQLLLAVFRAVLKLMAIIKNLDFRNVKKPLTLGFYVPWSEKNIHCFAAVKKRMTLIQDCVYTEPCVKCSIHSETNGTI